MGNGSPCRGLQHDKIDKRGHKLRQCCCDKRPARRQATIERRTTQADASRANSRHEGSGGEYGNRIMGGTQPIRASENDKESAKSRYEARAHDSTVRDVTLIGMTASKKRCPEKHGSARHGRDDEQQRQIESIDLVVGKPQRPRIGKRRPGGPHAERHERQRRPARRQLFG